ncbi:MAG: hypothetical protein C4520_21435 [Candidatus Abyssobacteria bacterium SURF_5]|uniref:Uncharacterized protein n=1 Tax=Abyssobacteria bacterium (strain SURF_5) TaxID=2093360 RepID=A0A3A4N4B1_ABYX5|nr:MAG: hypothetical protein C4520_21435 [Candidatus Abyssubacteria bacterium SURF_5]
MKKTVGVVVALFFLFSISSGTFGQEASGEYHPNRVLVKFKQAPSAADLQKFSRAHQLRLEKIIPKVEAFLFGLPKAVDVKAAIKQLEASGLVEYAEPDYVRYPTYVPTDPLFGSQWDMTLMKLPLWWDLDKGSPSVVVAVLDTGIDLDHPDLVSQLWQNADETPGDGDDDDGNGYVDDYNGYDFAGDGWLPGVGAEDPIPEDQYVGHGTHVSGTIAAAQDNGAGISGEAPGVKVMAVRVLGGLLGMGYSSDICDGLIYATDNGASVINMSLGGTAKSLTEYNSLRYAWDRNVFIAAAAGNDGDSGNPLSYPAAYVFPMSIGATDSIDNIASFSTHNEFVEVSAPGVTVLSTVPGGGYESAGWSGTSMATPHAAGLAALLYSMYSGIENWQVRAMLQQGVIDRGVAGWDEYYGYGRADCEQLLAVATPSPDVLQILTPANGSRFRTGALVAALWNPVTSAVSYRLDVTLPSGAKKVITTNTPYYTVDPAQPLPLGTYVLRVEALSAGGSVISYDTVTFQK